MNGSLGSPPRQKVTMAMIDSVPPIAPREEIEYVIKNVYSFFRYQARLNYSFLPLSVKYFVHPIVPERKLTEDEAKQIELFSKKYRSQMFGFLAERPQICRAAAEKIAFRQVSVSQRKNFYYELMQIAFYSDSLELFKLAMVDTPRPPAKRTLRNPVSPVLAHIERVERSVGLFIDEESKGGEFLHFLDEIPSTTAVAASPTVVFVGKKGGEVRVLTTVGKGLNVRSFLLRAVGAEPYSLVWVHQSLWMITGSDVWKLHSLESEPVAVEKPAKMGMAVCTDGHYFYAFKRSEVNVFEFDGSVFVFIRAVKLNPSVCAVADELNVSFVADGGLMSFAVQRKKEVMFKSYSLVTGKLISSHVSSSLIDICGWCIRPFSNEHVLLSKSSMTLYHGVLQMPRWMMCVRYPVVTEENQIQSALEVALYHGASFFESGSVLVLHQLLEGYCATGDSAGIMIVGHILLRSMEMEKNDWTRLAELFVGYYSKCKSEPTMQRFCCFMYLACMKSSLGVVKSSVFSEYVMTGAKDIDFIFVFPSAIRFNSEYISPKAMDKIIEHCVDAWLSFPCEASFLIQEYIRNYMKPMFKKGEIGSVIGTLQKIMNGITQAVNLVLNNMRDAESFCSSGQFSAWGYILMMIREEKKYWPRFGHQLIPLLQLGLHNQNVDRPSLAKIRDMMNRTMVVLLELIFAVPKHISFVQFKTADAFYQRYPSVMRGYDSELDQLIIKFLDKTYDIFTESDYYAMFHEVQRIILFDKGDDRSLLEAIPDERYSSHGIVTYLETGCTDALAPVQDDNIMEWCFKTMCAMRPLFTNEQKIITALFLASIRDMYPAELSMNSQLDPKMFYSAQLYFMLPKTMLSRYDECISSGYVMRMPPDMLAYCFNNILLLKKRISNPSDFLTPLKDALRRETTGNSLLPLFADLDQEQEHFREALLWLLALEIGVAISANSCEYIAEIENYIWGGSCRVVDAIMRGIVLCESAGVKGLEVLFETLFEIIFSFCTRQQNFFLLQDTTNIEPITTLCTILSYLKQMFNSQSGVFRTYLDNFARTCDRDHAVVVFAILNNSIEAPRKGVEAHFAYDLIDVVGVIDKVYYDSLSFSIAGKQYSFAKAHDMWCTPAVFVDLNLLTDVPLFVDLLVNTKYDDEVLNVFYYAALLEFVKNIKCLKCLPGDFLKRLSNMKCSDAFDMERYMTDFLFLLTSSLGRTSEFSFQELNDSRDVVKIPTLIRNCSINNEMETGNSGMLLSLDCATSFVSCPIHPECQIQVKFAVSSAESAQSVDICVYGIAKSRQGVLKTDNLQVIGGDKTAMVSFSPERLMISLSIDNELVSNTAISPSIEMFFLVVKLEPNTIVEYECDFTEQNHYAGVFPKCFKLEEGDSTPMSFSADLPFRPCVDSSLYTRLQLVKCARCVVANLKFLIVFYLYTKTTMKMQAKLALKLLLSANCILADETLTLESIPVKALWMNHGPKFLRTVRKRINDITQASLDKDFENFLGRYNIMPIMRDNTSALCVQGDSPIELANSFVFSPSLTTPLQIIGAGTKSIVAAPWALIIPITNFLGTVVETVVTAKHYIMLSMIKGSYEFGVVLDGFRKVKDSFPFTAPLFHRTIEMIRALSPPLPKPNCFPVFNDVSFFIPESRIFQFPDRYLLPRYVEYVVKPKAFQGELPASFKMPHPGLVYLGVHAVESTAHRLIFQVQDDDIVLPVPVNNFVILRNQKFTIACPDPSYTCGSVRFLICPKPDCDGVSEAMRRWKPHHSHELLLSVPQDKPLTLEFFRSLPLSTKFSLGTAKFVLALLRDQCINSCLTRYQNHLATVDQPVPDKPLKVTFTNLEDENDSLEANSIEYCRSVASITTMTKERKLYLTNKDLSLCHSIHPNFVRLAAQTRIPRELRAQITASIRAIAPGKRPEQWLKNLLTKMPSYALLMFIEFVTGQWGTSSLTATQTGHTNLFYVDSPDTLDTLPEQHILVVGRFSSEARFRRRLLLRLQKFHDRLLDQI